MGTVHSPKDKKGKNGNSGISRPPVTRSQQEDKLNDSLSQAIPGLDLKCDNDKKSKKGNSGSKLPVIRAQKEGTENDSLLQALLDLKNDLKGDNANLAHMLRNEMKSMKNSFDESTRYMNESFEAMRTAYNEVKAFCSDLSKSNTALLKENKNLKERIASLEGRVDAVEQQAKSENIIIRNLPAALINEPRKAVMQVAGKLEVPLVPSDMTEAYSIGGDEHSFSLVARIRNREIRHALMKNARIKKFDTVQLGFPSAPKNSIFINEDLTKRSRELFNMANAKRKHKDFDYKFIWTDDGITKIRKNKEAPVIKILTEADLAKIV